MANCLEFIQVITKAGVVTPVVGVCSPLDLYTVPAGHVAKINSAQNLGSSLLYGIKSGTTGVVAGSISASGFAAGSSPPSRHRNLSGTWIAEGDIITVYDKYDVTQNSSHPDGFYISVIEYDIITCP
tara:strand:- start:37 stop:417 length:381 start_codon:yes stop_codon:yes gene_type:complete